MGKIPRHIAIIPDGNRRWARRHGNFARPWEAYKKGVERFREVSEAAWKDGISHFTFWAASLDNLKKRSRTEIKFLLRLFENELKHGLEERVFEKHGVHLKVIGEWRRLLKDNRTLTELIDFTEAQTAKFKKNALTILFGYDGKNEMLEAIKTLREKNLNVSEKNLTSTLTTGSLPPVDLVIRTGGEPHWSGGFLMWQTADSQFYFTETLWPDFSRKDLLMALKDYAARERRFGT